MAIRYNTSQMLDMARNAVDKIVQNQLGQIDYLQAEISSIMNRLNVNQGTRKGVRTEAAIIIHFGGESRRFSVAFVPLECVAPEGVIPLGEASLYESDEFERDPQNAVNVYVADLRGKAIETFLRDMKEKRSAK